MEQQKKQSKALRLIVSNPHAYRHVFSILTTLFEDIPFHYEIAESPSDICNKLLNHEADISISTKQQSSPGIIELPLYKEYMKIYVPPCHPLYSQETISIWDLDGENVVVLDMEWDYLKYYFRPFTEHNIHMNPIQVEEWKAQQNLLYATKYLILSSSVAEKYIPIPKGMRNVSMKEQIQNITYRSYFFSFATDRSNLGELYLEWKPFFNTL